MTAARTLKAQKLPPPLERAEQYAYFQWLYYFRYQSLKVYDHAYAIPNGSFLAGDVARRAIQGHALKLVGVKAGYPDVGIDIAVAPYHGLKIEFKRVGGPKPTPEQLIWHERLRLQGYQVAVCHGFAAAQEVTLRYFGQAREGMPV